MTPQPIDCSITATTDKPGRRLLVIIREIMPRMPLIVLTGRNAGAILCVSLIYFG